MLASGLFDVFGTTIGVMIGLCAVALVLLGLIALGDGSRRTGARTALAGAVLLAIALWLVGWVLQLGTGHAFFLSTLGKLMR